jgi:isopentenyl diphosphate isomerase/L-lactate dehydrogenase-like FMN-dependent dehydrogenase
MTTPAIDLADIKTIGQVIAAARKILDPGVFTWAASGAGVEVTVARNTRALGALALIPRLLVDVTNVEISTSFLGVPLQIPVMMAPIGALALYHPDDARASGEGAARAGTSIFCGILSDKPWEEVAATAPRRHFFQMYALGDRSWLGRVIERVENAAFAGICLTADSPAIARRDSSLAGGYEWNIYRGEGPANLADIGYDPEFKRSFTWSDLQWLNRATSLPLILKGVMSAADALRAIDCGVKGIYVSNHGGRAVDHGLSPMEVLAEIVAAVDGRAEVIVDSGFTRGAEICKALALGARAVAIGRLQCWALAIGGAAGVERVLDILSQEIQLTMTNLGCRSVGDLTAEMVRWSLPLGPGRVGAD